MKFPMLQIRVQVVTTVELHECREITGKNNKRENLTILFVSASVAA